MLSLILRRLAIASPVLVVIASVSFLLVQLIPGDPGRVILGQGATDEQVAAVNHQLGLDRPLPEQFGSFWLGLIQGDLGRSLINGQPVTTVLGNALPVTLSLAVMATLVAALIGISLGVLSALRGGWVNSVVQSTSSLAMSVPNFWLAVLLVFVFSLTFNVLPATGYTDFFLSPAFWAKGLILPVIAIALAGVATIARQTRSSMLETLDRPYIRSLQAAGIPPRSIIYRHALRNASIPIVTSIGFQFIGILGGTIIIEQVFALPGMGKVTLDAVNQHDLPIVQASVLVMAGLVLLVNLTVDVLYGILNPKTRRA